MDTAPLVEEEIEDGRKLIKQLVCDGFDVTVAFWVRFQSEEDGLGFYISSKTVDKEGLQAAFGAVHDALHRIPAPWGSWMSVTAVEVLRLVGVDNPLAKDVLAFRDLFPGRSRFRRPGIGRYGIEELYIYPPVTTSAGTERCGKHTINIGTTAEPEFIDLERVPIATIIRDPAGPSKVVLVGGGKPERALEGEEAQRLLAELDAIRKEMG